MEAELRRVEKEQREALIRQDRRNAENTRLIEELTVNRALVYGRR